MAKKSLLDFLNPPPTPEGDAAFAPQVEEGSDHSPEGAAQLSQGAAQPAVTETLEQRLESAANLLLSQFTPPITLFAEEVADVVLKIPRWQLICGSLLAQYEGGSLPAPSIDPAWVREGTLTGTRECAYCHKHFEPFKAFQKYCDNVCGNAAAYAARQVKVGGQSGMGVGAT
jgi:hypothetical protein